MLLSVLLLSAAASLAEGDVHIARRAEGAKGERCEPREVEQALVAYRRALAAEPDSLAARIGVLRGLFFRGGFCGEHGEQQKATFEDAKRLAEDSMRRLEARVGKRKGAAHAAALKDIPGAGALAFWSATAWGQWSLDHKLAAAWQGAAGKIRDLSELAIALDPGYEQGGPYIVLGRLHAAAPKIPLLTGFISRRKAIESLRRAHELAPHNSIAMYFLADTLLDHEPKRRDEALTLLEKCAAVQPREDYLIEDRHYMEMAKRRLADPRARE